MRQNNSKLKTVFNFSIILWFFYFFCLFHILWVTAGMSLFLPYSLLFVSFQKIRFSIHIPVQIMSYLKQSSWEMLREWLAFCNLRISCLRAPLGSWMAGALSGIAAGYLQMDHWAFYRIEKLLHSWSWLLWKYLILLEWWPAFSKKSPDLQFVIILSWVNFLTICVS